jgi:hypothetical protein
MSDDPTSTDDPKIIPIDKRPPPDWEGNDRRPGGHRPGKRWKPPKRDPIINLGLLDEMQQALRELPVGEDPRRRVHQSIARLVADLMGQEDVDSRQMQRHVLACRTIGEHADHAVVDPRGGETTEETYEDKALAFLDELQQGGLDESKLGNGAPEERAVVEDEAAG